MTKAQTKAETLIRNSFSFNSTPVGDIGIEIEVETLNDRLHRDSPPKEWACVHDGSLRGYCGEYILTKPVAHKRVTDVLHTLTRYMASREILPQESVRTSVHVHVNMLRSTFTQTVNFITLYAIFEDQLIEWCGEDRVGNHFCLSISKAEFLKRVIQRACRQVSFRGVLNDNIRYSAINLNALSRFGSLEFRALRGTTDVGVISTWVDILMRLKKYSGKFKSPLEMLDRFETLGTSAFTSEVFQESVDVITHKDNLNWEYRTKVGYWLAQDIAAAYEEGTKTEDVYSNTKSETSQPEAGHCGIGVTEIDWSTAVLSRPTTIPSARVQTTTAPVEVAEAPLYPRQVGYVEPGSPLYEAFTPDVRGLRSGAESLLHRFLGYAFNIPAGYSNAFLVDSTRLVSLGGCTRESRCSDPMWAAYQKAEILRNYPDADIEVLR
jgi:hypothetical protein